MRNLEIVNKYLETVTQLQGEAHKNFWKEWEEQKSKKLFGLFGDKLIIEKEISILKQERHIVEHIKEKRLDDLIYTGFDKIFRDILHRPGLYSWRQDELTPDEVELLSVKEAVSVMYNNHYLAGQTFCKDYVFKSPITNKVVKLQRGGKISKALKHFISDPEVLNNIQVLYSQILNDKFLRGTLCLSIHPMDYLTASVNDSGWDSCYNTMDKGQYCASTLCLNNSPNTFIAYLKSDRDMVIGYNDDITWNNKKWRTWVTLGEDNEVCHIGRNYPYENGELMSQVVSMVADLAKKDYEGFVTNNGFVHIITPYNMYNDAEHSELYVAMTETYALKSEIYPPEKITVSPNGSICPICGDCFDNIEEDVVCANCGDFDTCHNCGGIAHDGDRIWVNSIEAYVCDGCSCEYSYCEECDEYFADGEVNIVKGYCGPNRSHHAVCYACNDCCEHNEKITQCVTCGDWIYDECTRPDGTCYDCEELPIEDEAV